MQFDIHNYCHRLKEALCSTFGPRLCYMGLQGSWLRGEATERSDIDIVVILDTLDCADMDTYRTIIERLGDFDRSCGFICSKDDLRRWNPLEICQLQHTTRDLYGKLSDFLPAWTMEDQRNYVKLSLNNLYHALCHSYIHGDREAFLCDLPGYYKSVFFILQNTHYLETGLFARTKAELLARLEGEDKALLQTAMELAAGRPANLTRDLTPLLRWCQSKLSAI